MIVTIKCKLAAVQEGQYTIYVFDNVDEQYSSYGKYITCTKLPNWNYNDEIKVGELGYLHCEFVTAGSTYYKVNTQSAEIYQYSNCYFINFIKEKEKINEKEFEF